MINQFVRNSFDVIKQGLILLVVHILFSITLFGGLALENLQLRVIVIVALWVFDFLVSFFVMRSFGEHEFKEIANRLKEKLGDSNQNKLIAALPRPYGFHVVSKSIIVCSIACLLTIILAIISAAADNAQARFLLLLLCGWAYTPVSAIYLGIIGPDATIPSGSSWYSFIIIAVYLIVCVIAYIVGAYKEEGRQMKLANRLQIVEHAKKNHENQGDVKF